MSFVIHEKNHVVFMYSIYYTIVNIICNSNHTGSNLSGHRIRHVTDKTMITNTMIFIFIGFLFTFWTKQILILQNKGFFFMFFLDQHFFFGGKYIQKIHHTLSLYRLDNTNTVQPWVCIIFYVIWIYFSENMIISYMIICRSNLKFIHPYNTYRINYKTLHKMLPNF